MADGFAAPPINPVISITPLSTPPASRDATSVPAQLANVTPGTLIEGFVVNRDAQSNPILRTPLGDILVKSDVFIKTGSEVAFRVDTSQQGFARIVTIDGQAPQYYAAAQGRPIATDTVSATRLPTGATTVAATGLEQRSAAPPLQAVLVSTTPLPAAAIAANPLLAATLTASNPIPAGLLKLQLGSQLQVKLLQVDLPVSLAAPSSRTAAPALQRSAEPYVPLPGPERQQAAPQQTQSFANANTARIALNEPPVPHTATPNAPAPLPGVAVQEIPELPELPAAMQLAPLKAQIAANTLPLPGDRTLPKNPTAGRTQAASSQGIPAQVIGHEKDGAMILQTRIGTIKLHSPQPLPVGTSARIALTPMVKEAATPVTAPAVPEEIEPLTSLAQRWPALEETIATFPPQNAAVGQPLMQAMPEVGHKLTSGLLFFMAAVKGGELKQWIGTRTLAALESKAPELAARLKQDMAQLQTLLIDSPLPNWSSAMVPLLYQGQLEHARLFFRHDQESESGGEPQKRGAKDQRFIVEVDLSHLGEMQFDGFVRPGSKAKQFDLIVRSSLRLPEALQQEIRTTFETAMQTTGMTGYLGFQQGSQHFVRPLADQAAPRSGGGPQPILA